MVVLLVLVVVVLILVSRGGNVFTDFGGEKIDIGGDVTDCEMICFKCCRSDRLDFGDGAPQAIRDCNCEDIKPTEIGC